MKKTIFAIATVMALMSCGGATEEASVANDSAFIDSVLVADTVDVGGGIQDGTEVK